MNNPPYTRVDPDYMLELRGMYADWRALWGATEMTYYDDFGILPSWARVIERIEEYPEGRLVIHYDPDLTNDTK